jgi:hypothetical protein
MPEKCDLLIYSIGMEFLTEDSTVVTLCRPENCPDSLSEESQKGLEVLSECGCESD